MDVFKRRLRDAHKRVKRASDAVDEATQTDIPRSIKIAKRTNIVVARNVGGTGSAQAASSRQTIRIRQRDGEAIDMQTDTDGSVVEP